MFFQNGFNNRNSKFVILMKEGSLGWSTSTLINIISLYILTKGNNTQVTGRGNVSYFICTLMLSSFYNNALKSTHAHTPTHPPTPALEMLNV